MLVFFIYTIFTLLITDGGLGSVLTPLYSIFLFLVLKRSELDNKKLMTLTIVLIGVNLFLVINSPGYYNKWL